MRRQDPAARAGIFRGSACFAPVGEGQSSTVSGDQGFAVENSEGGVGERGIGVGDIDQNGASGALARGLKPAALLGERLQRVPRAHTLLMVHDMRSDERRVGKEWGGKWR